MGVSLFDANAAGRSGVISKSQDTGPVLRNYKDTSDDVKSDHKSISPSADAVPLPSDSDRKVNLRVQHLDMGYGFWS